MITLGAANYPHDHLGGECHGTTLFAVCSTARICMAIGGGAAGADGALGAAAATGRRHGAGAGTRPPAPPGAQSPTAGRKPETDRPEHGRGHRQQAQRTVAGRADGGVRAGRRPARARERAELCRLRHAGAGTEHRVAGPGPDAAGAARRHLGSEHAQCHRRHLYRRRAVWFEHGLFRRQRADAGHRSRRRRAHRGAARPAGHPVWLQYAGRTGQVRHHQARQHSVLRSRRGRRQQRLRRRQRLQRACAWSTCRWCRTSWPCGSTPIPATIPAIPTTSPPGKKDVDDAKVRGGRAQLLWTPADNFSLRLSALAQNLSGDGAGQHRHRCRSAHAEADLWRPEAEPRAWHGPVRRALPPLRRRDECRLRLGHAGFLDQLQHAGHRLPIPT